MNDLFKFSPALATLVSGGGRFGLKILVGLYDNVKSHFLIYRLMYLLYICMIYLQHITFFLCKFEDLVGSNSLVTQGSGNTSRPIESET